MNKQKRALINSAISLVLCFSMLLGTTWAWFTDSASTAVNTIQSGTLKVGLVGDDGNGNYTVDLEGQPLTFYNKDGEDEILWEPGVTFRTQGFKVVNKGNLALKYKLAITGINGDAELLKAIDFWLITESENNKLDLNNHEDRLVKDQESVVYYLVGHMKEEAGNEYQGKTLQMNSVGITVYATQDSVESDSFGNTYDAGAEYPEGADFVGGKASADVSVDSNGKVASEVTMSDGSVSATVPAGVQVKDGVEELTLSVTKMPETTSNVVAEDDQILIPVDVHIDGVAEENTVPMTIAVKGLVQPGLNLGNMALYHVENGVTNAMTQVGTITEVDAHNEFYYAPATGDITMALATFSEIAVAASTVNAWEGNFDYSWYDADKKELTIANGDQLAAFGAIVGGMNGQTRDSFSGKTVKLICDINIGDTDSENGIVFYPIGYYNSTESYTKTSGGSVTSGFYTFEGTFDGNGHTISNFYQNTWEMFGDYNDGYSGTPNHFRDGMGLFGKVYGGTVKNLTVDSFSSDGEFTTTGVIAAYADSATFENIAITNCNPRVYNIGNGGIVGCVGWYAKEADLKTTFTNITVDNSNKISALWGSYDVACGGIVGQYYPTSGQTSDEGTAIKNAGIHMENCHVAAQMDVYNDVCGNYQYYAYRYAGMMIGSIRENTTNEDGKTIPDMTGISATDCTVNYGDWNDYYYCEFEKNGHPSYSGPDDYKFSRVPHSELNFTDSNGNGVVDADERASVTGCKHDHTDAENNKAIYLPFHQLFTGYGWGVNSIGLKEYSGIVTNLDITEGDQEESVVKFESKFTGDFLYRVGNKNTVSLGSLFKAKDGMTINSSGVWATIEKVDENMDVSGTFTANTSDWTKGTIQFTGTGVVKVTIQDYNYCTPTVLYLEVVDATNLTSATGTTSGGTFVLLCDVNASAYVYYWNATLYGNGFTYSLNGAPTAYSSSHGHGVLMTKNATLDNLVIVGDVYEAYGAYTNQDYYNAAVDVLGDTIIQNCYISGCAAPVNVRSNVTIKNTTLYGGAVANLMIKSGTVTLEDVTTANYADGRALVGMGIVAHSDVSESAKLIINGTLKQYNFVNENNIPSDSNAKILYNAMFDDACSQYHFNTDEGKYVNTGIISMSALFNASDITDNANTGYVGSPVTVSGVNGYVYTQLSSSGSVNNNCPEYKPTTQGAVPPSYSFDYTTKNYVAKTDGSNDYCYEDNGTVYISMDEGDSFDWNTSIATITKQGNTLDYTVTMNGTDYTGKTITFDTAGDYKVSYTYTDGDNNSVDENGKLTTYEVTYTKTIAINVSIIKPTTKHAEFTFGSSNQAVEQITVDNKTYLSATNKTANGTSWGCMTVGTSKIYYPIVEAEIVQTKASSMLSANAEVQAYFYVFDGTITISDYENSGAGNSVTYNSSTTTMPSGLTVVKGNYGKISDNTTWYSSYNDTSLSLTGAENVFKYAGSNAVSSTPTTRSDKLCYASDSGLSTKNRSEYYTLVQYQYTDNAGAIYYYYVGYHMQDSKNVAPDYSGGCFAEGTLITLADGTQKRIDRLTYEDELLVWDFYNGCYATTTASVIFNHGDGIYKITNLHFSDGTTVKMIAEHEFFDVDANSFVYISEENISDYIGHSFVKADGEGYTSVTLENYSFTEEETGCYTILTAKHFNALVEGVFSLTPDPTNKCDMYFRRYEVGENMKYDEDKMQADIEKYGLYTYEDFADYVTYEEFVAFDGEYLKVLVGKGWITYEDILNSLSAYAPNH